MREKKPNPFLQKIFDLRKAKKISLSSLGKAMGNVKKGTASAIENGDVPLKTEYIPAIAKLLGVQPWELFVDYQEKEVGPLSEEEKDLILEVRKMLPDAGGKKVLTHLLKRLAK